MLLLWKVSFIFKVQKEKKEQKGKFLDALNMATALYLAVFIQHILSIFYSFLQISQILNSHHILTALSKKCRNCKSETTISQRMNDLTYLGIYKSGIRIGIQIYFFTDIVIFWCKFGIWHPLVRNAIWPFYAKIAFFLYFFSIHFQVPLLFHF